MLNQEQQTIELIKKSQNILLTFNKNWNADAVSSALAFYIFLKKLDKNVDIVAEENEQSGQLSFLPKSNIIKNDIDGLRKFIITLDLGKNKIDHLKYKVEDNKLNFYILPKTGRFSPSDVNTSNGDFKYDLVIALDTEDLESLGKIYTDNQDFFYRTPILNVDHSSGNESFGQINYTQLVAVSTTEILFELFTAFRKDLIDEDVATCLLAGMISETKSFKTSNVKPQTLSIAAKLMSFGARREEIVNKFYRSRSLNLLKLWGRVLAKLSSSMNDMIIYSTLTSSDFEKTESNDNDLSAVIDELIINIPQAKIIALFYEINDGQEAGTRAIIYSTKNIDALAIVKEYNPKGTKKLSKIKIKAYPEEAKNKIIKTIENSLAKITN